ncbi:MAG: dTDP-4-dehydrorhamnose reductase [Halomonadaceae bacterium]|nr:MAG: dTDP-4-dehydrorhamnose reductase [Halomonadaceae bacterium]
MKVLVIYEPDLTGHLLLERLQKTTLEVVPLLLSQPESLDPGSVQDWLTEDIDLVVNLLTLDDPQAVEMDPAMARHRLLALPAALADAAAAREIAMLQLSSCYIFDGRKQSSYLASNPGQPLGLLGQLLWQSEQHLRSVLPRHILLRTSWPLRRFCQFLLQQQGTLAPLHLSSRYRGQPVPAADLARVITAILQQIDCGAEVWGTYQYAGLEETSQFELGLTISQAMTVRPVPRLVDDMAAWMDLEPENATLNCRKLRNTFGIKPLSWRDALPQELAQLESPPLEGSLQGSTVIS